MGLGPKVQAQITSTVGQPSGTNDMSGANAYPCPIQDRNKVQRAQYLYAAWELKAAGILPGATITQIGWRVRATTISGHLIENYSISLKNTSTVSLSTSSWEGGLSPVYGPASYSYSSGHSGQVLFNTSSFIYTGGNLLVEVCGGTGSGSWVDNPKVEWTTGLPFNASHTYTSDTPPSGSGCGEGTTTHTGAPTSRPRLVVTHTASCTGIATAFSPAAISSGFTVDVVANGTALPQNSTDVTFDLGAHYLVDGTYRHPNAAYNTPVPYHLPDNRVIQVSALPGLTFELQPYNAKNSLRVFNVGNGANSGTLTLQSQMRASHVYLLAASGSGSATISATVNFEDGTQQAFTNLSVPDWFGGNSNIAAQGIGRVNQSQGLQDNTSTASDPRLYYIPLSLSAANVSKLIKSVTISHTSAAHTGIVNILAVSLKTQEPQEVQACGGLSTHLSLIGAATGSYQWEQSSAPDGLFNNVSGGSGATTTSYTTPPLSAATTYYRARITCSGGSTGYSNTVAVRKKLCPCTQSAYNANHWISQVTTTGGLTNISKSSGRGTAGVNGYENFYATDSVMAYPGATVQYSVTVTGGGSYQPGIWVDFNEDGVFQNHEKVDGSSGNVASPLSGSFTVPAGTVPGPKRMRIWAGTGTMALPCTDVGEGECEDYKLVVAPPFYCTGTPAVSPPTASVSSACPPTAITLHASNLPIGYAGVAFQWQSAPAGSQNFTDLSGATTVPYLHTGQTVATDYRLRVTCTNSGGNSTSNAVSVGQKLPNNCHCTPALSGTSYYISRFTTTGGLTNISNNSGKANGYQDFYATAAASAYPGMMVNYSITVSGNNSFGRAIWIDFNEDGVFQSSEQVAGSTSYANSPLVGSFTIPAGALPGDKRMRVLAVHSPSNPSNPCSSGSDGEYEDYKFTVAPVPACAGVPATPQAISSVTSVCAGVGFTLDISNPPQYIAGITYQWESAPAGSSNFTPISGATTVPYPVAGQAAATDYRLLATCTQSGQSAVSNSVSVGSNLCHCVPVVASSSQYYISQFSTSGGLTNINNSSGIAGGYQNFYPTAAASAYPGATLSYSITVAGNNDFGRAIWIDLNEDGVFQSSEQVAGSTNRASSPLVGSFTIPAGTLPGDKRMRVLAVHYPNNPSNPCSSSTSDGEYEDYKFTVATVPACGGVPATPAASASVAVACSTTAFTLHTTGTHLFRTGITYQWQSAPAGSPNFTPISGAATASYTVSGQTVATDYQLTILCSNSGQSAVSNIVRVGTSPCYCTPRASNATVYYISNFTTTGGLTNIQNTSAGSSSGYQDFYATPAASAYPGDTIQYSIMVDGAYSNRRAIWIDFNEDGVFQSSEQVENSFSYEPSPITGSIVIPAGTQPGAKRMRVVAGYLTGGASVSCGDLSYDGEYEDYNFTVVPFPLCTGAPAAPVVTASASSACFNVPLVLSAAGLPARTSGISYQWESAPAGSFNFTPISGATTVPYTIAGQTAATDYRLLVVCANSGQTTLSNILSVSQNPAVACPCIPSGVNGATIYINSFSTSGGLTNIQKNSGNSTRGYTDYFTTDSASAYAGTTLQYNMSVSGNSFGGALWIDLNEDGVFQSTEQLVTGSANTYNYPSLTGSFTIPAGTPPGPKRMRILAFYNAPNPTDPCGSQMTNAQGEYEDYKFVVAPLLPCSGTPTPGTAFTYTPAPVTGFTADVIANGTGAPTTSTTDDFDGSNYYLLDATYRQSAGSSAPTYALPANGILNSASTPGLTFRLAGAAGNNTLRLTGSRNSGPLTLTQPTPATTVYVLAAAGSGSATLNATVNFTDGTSTTFPGVGVSDWYNGSSVAIYGVGRVGSGGTLEGNSSNPRLYEYALLLPATDHAKEISGITCAYAGGGTSILNVLGISLRTSQLSAVCGPRTAVLELEGYAAPDPGISYQWEQSSAPNGPFIPAAGSNTATTYTTPALTATTYYRAKVSCAASGSDAYSNVVPVEIIDPNIIITQPTDQTVCAGSSFQLSVTTTGPASYQWNLNGTPIAGADSATYNVRTASAAVAGTYTVTVSGTSPCGPVTLTSDPAVVTVMPMPGAAISYSNPSYCVSSGLVNVNHSGTQGGTFSGTPGLSIDPATGSIDPVASVPGPHIVIYTVAATGGCNADTTTTTVFVEDPLVTMTPSLINTVCGSGTARLDISIGNALAPALQWSSQQGLYQDSAATLPYTGDALQSPLYAKLSSDMQYHVTVASNGCAGNTATAALNVTNSIGQLAANSSSQTAIPVGTALEVRDDNCQLLATISPSGAQPVSGSLATHLYIAGSVPTVMEAGFARPYVQRYYQITPDSNAATATATLTLYATNAEFQAYNAAAAGLSLPSLPDADISTTTHTGNVIITQESGASSTGAPGSYTPGLRTLVQPTSVVWNATANNGIGQWEITFPVTGFSGFFISTGTTPLPVTFLGIAARATGGRNRVDWQVGAEEQVSHYEVEKQSNKVFTAIGRLPAIGKTDYVFYDETPVSGRNIYRVKAVDINGSVGYSPVATVIVNDNNRFALELFPNPTQNTLTIRSRGAVAAEATLAIRELSGRLIRQHTVRAAEDVVDLSVLPAGTYLLQWHDGVHKETVRVTRD